MVKRTIVVLPGDGIGGIVLNEALKVLDAVGFEAEYLPADVGWKFWCSEGNPLPERTVLLLKKYKIGLFAAVTSKPKDLAEAELNSDLKGKGLKYLSPIVALRQIFGLDICMRPCKSFPGNPLNFIRRTADGRIEEPIVDVMIFRQNTECLYSGVEWTDPPDIVYDAFLTHDKFREYFAGCPKNEMAISARIFTKKYVSRIVRAAFNFARSKGLKKLIVCEKPNVIRETSGMMLKVAYEIAAGEFPEISVVDINVDAMMMWMTKNPEDFQVIVSGNMFGDIVSDGFAGLTGGLGFASSANIGDDVAVFEPTHGSAPKYAFYDPPIINPIAMILSSCLMLDYLKENEKADKIRKAIYKVIYEGKIKTFDMLRLTGTDSVINSGAATTFQMTEAIISKLNEI